MQAKEIQRPHEAHWFRAGEWLTVAFRRIKAAPDQLTRLQALHVKRLICLFESALRRLILLAALAMKLDHTPPRPRRSPPHDRPVRRSGARRTPVRLYAFGQRTQAHAAASSQPVAAHDPNTAHDNAPCKPRFHIGQSDCFIQSGATARASHTSRPHREATGPAESIDLEEPPPELLPPELRLTVNTATPKAAPVERDTQDSQHATPASATSAAPPAVLTKQPQPLACLPA